MTSTNRRKDVVQFKRGLEQPRRFRPNFLRTRRKGRFFRRKPRPWRLEVRRLRFKPRGRRTVRFKSLNKRRRARRAGRRKGYWGWPRAQRYVSRWRPFYSYYRGKYVSRQSVFSAAPTRAYSRRERNLRQRFVGRPYTSLVRYAQPTFLEQRFRSSVLRAINLAVTGTPRKVIQLVAARRVALAGSVRASSSRNQVRAVVRQRLYGARRGRRPTINGLRKLRLLAVEASATTLMHLVARGATLRRTTTKALRARLHRQNKRAATGFSRPVRGPKPRRRFWRQGRRGYAGLFGKRRYRVGRRDRVLVRRASRRLTLCRALAARVLSARATRRNFAVRVRRYSAAAGQHFLSNTSSSAARARFLTARAQGYAYTFGRMSITQRRYRATRRTSRSSRTVNSILPKPAVRTMSASARGARQQLLQYVANPKILQDYQQLIACRQWNRFKRDSSPRLRVYALTSGASVAAPLSLTAPWESHPAGTWLSKGQTLPLPTYSVSNIRMRTRAQYSFWSQKKGLTARRIYAFRPRLRLPRTTVTRQRRRKGGLGAFVQNNLRTPRTLTGVRNVMLPPVGALSRAHRYDTPVHDSTAGFYEVDKQADDKPRYWARRRHRWVDLAPAFWVTNRSMVRARRHRYRIVRKGYLTKGRARPSAYVRKIVALAATTDKLTAPSRLGGVAASALRIAFAQRVRPAPRSVRIAAQSFASRRSHRLLSAPMVSNIEKRRTSIWHARSTRLMRQVERGLPAWSPQYQTRRRRWAAPRQDGVLLRRSWPSVRVRRERHKLNRALLRRHLPQRRYWDRSFIHLQYYQGSAASSGYIRLRRSHRLHSRFSRWWRPITYGVPFVHPYNRRFPNSKYYYRQALDPAARLQKGAAINISPLVRARPALRVERHMISRKIPWRNFNYPTPRRGAPAVVQRWTVCYKGRNVRRSAGLVRSGARLVTLSRSSRELRQLEDATPSSAAWADRRWEFLDPRNQSSVDTAYATKIFNHIPTSIWTTLKVKAGSLPRYAALQRAILNNYRAWVTHVYGTTTALTPVAFAQSVQYLLSVVRSILSSAHALDRAVQLEVSQVQQKQVRQFAVAQRLNIKQSAFIKSRGLAASSDIVSNATTSSFTRENSHLYKRWLRGAEHFLQRAQQGYIPTSRSRYSPNLALDFGRTRLRFPASGRRKRSFDSMLHAFVKRVGPSRFRRAATLRFVRSRPQHNADFRVARLSTCVESALKRQRALIRKLGKIATLSTPWREVLNRRAAAASVQQASVVAAGKYRFMPLPATLLYKQRSRNVKQQSNALTFSLRALRVGVLRRALRRRRSERAFIDLRKAAIQRRTPLERSLRPGKLRWRKRLRRSARAKPWRRLRAAPAVAWGLSHLGTKATRLSDRAAITKTASPVGELWALPKSVLRRGRWALRGFSALPTRRTRRLRRKVRDSRKSMRGRRRRYRTTSPRQAVLAKTHWSEGKGLGSFRRLRPRRRRARMRKFLVAAPKLFAAAYGERRRLTVNSSRRRASSIGEKLVFNTLVAAREQRFARRRGRALALSSVLLRNTSSLRRRLHFAKRARCGLTRRKTAALLRKRGRANLWQIQKVALYNQGAQYIGRTLADSLPEHSGIGPLYFQNPTTKIIKSAGAKAKELEADIASKEARYKLTAQYVESLTRLVPELINFMFSKQISQEHRKITLDVARHLVRNIYWSLRIYLNVDPFDVRFTIRDRNPAVRVRLGKLMDELALTQRTEQPQRAALRFRFQPARLLRLRNKLRFRGDWLRNFLPAKHALYLENAEEYGLFLLKTKQIRRLRFGPRGIASWTTTAQQTTQETRARQLLSLRYSRVTSRFETMLQGTRRSPEAECAPLVFGHRPLPTGFFARNFSTGSRGLPLVGKRLRQQSRFVSPDEDAVAAPFTSVVSRYRVTPRVESRGKTSYTGTERPSMLYPFLDTRLTRTKSPRSRQYLVRTAAASLARQLDALATYRTTVSRLVSRDAPTYLTRSARRFSRPAFAGAALTRGQPALSRLRKSALSRVTPQLLIAEQGERAHRVTTQRQIVLTNRRTANPRGWSISTNAVRHHGLSVQSTRAALLSRTAAARSTSFTFRAALVLPPHTFLPFLNPANRRSPGPLGSKRRRRPVFASERLQQALSRSAFAIRRTLARMSDAHEKTLRGCGALLRRQQEWKARLSHLKGKLATSLKPRERLEISRLTKDVAGARKRLVAKQEEYRHLWLASFIKLLERAVELRKSANVRPLSASNPLTLEQRILTPALPGPHVFVYGGAVHSTMGVVTEACAEETRDRQQTPFDSYRTKLWDKLTLRRMKKERIVRYWIRGTSRWMRDPWIAEIVGLDLRNKPGRLAGEIRAVEQQIGQYVSDVDERGKDIPYSKAKRERHAFAPRPQPKLTELKLLSRVKAAARPFVRQRLKISKTLRRKPIPAMWLANYEYNDFWREFKEERAKPWEQRREEALTKRKEAAVRAVKGELPERPRRQALKLPPLPQLPKVIWKEIHRRARRLEWRESDEVFFRKGFRNAFRFYPQERSRAPWLEALMYNRATFSTRLREFRRRQFPREQKKYKWLQRVRKSFFSTRTNRYIRGRRWSQLRIYNQRLHCSLFNLPDRNAARRHFRKLNRRTRPAISSFVSATRGLGDRLDVTLLHLKLVPSIFWARVVAPFGLLRVNGVLQKDPAYRIPTNAIIHLEWDRIARFQHFFRPTLSRREAYQRRVRRSTSSYPTNFEYHRGTRTIIYRHAPDEADLRRSSRLQANMFRWFKLDSI